MKIQAVVLAVGLACVQIAANGQEVSALASAVERIQGDDPANRVLNQLQAATLALDAGKRAQAGQLFDEALAGISTVYAGDEKAAKARSLWQAEGSKDFKGEPYERAMAYYYRGLLDMMEGDYENARASFRSGVLQDAFAEEEQHQSDFALLVFLEAWCSHQLGARSLADEGFAELKKLRPDFVRPPKDHNVLIIAESGKAPRKLKDGIEGNYLVYRQGKRFSEQKARLVMGKETHVLEPIESIFFQASTRGGRPVDAILAGKAQFKQNTETVALGVSELSKHGALLSSVGGNSSASGVFAGVAAVAGLATLATSNVNAAVDTRYWNNLPDRVHVMTMAWPRRKGAGTGKVEFLDKSGNPVPEVTQNLRIQLDKKGRAVAWVRARRAHDVDTQPKQ